MIDKNRLKVPAATNNIELKIKESEENIATDNGGPTDFSPFPSHERKAVTGLALAIVPSIEEEKGLITVMTKSP